MKPIDMARPCRSGAHIIPAGHKQCYFCRDIAAARRALHGPTRRHVNRKHLSPEEKRRVRNAYQVAWKQANPTPPEVIRDRNLRHRHGLPLEQWTRIYQAQKGCCLLCGKPFGAEMPVVDHDHKTGKVRGLLHKVCNGALGVFNDDPSTMAAFAEAYAKRVADGFASRAINVVACSVCFGEAEFLSFDDVPYCSSCYHCSACGPEKP